MGKKAEQLEWQRIEVMWSEGDKEFLREVWGIQITKGTKLKNIPQDLKCCFERFEGGQYPLTFEQGKFFFVTWNEWDRTLHEIQTEDWIVVTDTWDIQVIPKEKVRRKLNVTIHL